MKITIINDDIKYDARILVVKYEDDECDCLQRDYISETILKPGFETTFDMSDDNTLEISKFIK